MSCVSEPNFSTQRSTTTLLTTMSLSTVALETVPAKMCVVLLVTAGLFQIVEPFAARHGRHSETMLAGITCSAPPTRLGGQSTLTFDLGGDLLRSGQTISLNVRRDDANVTDDDHDDDDDVSNDLDTITKDGDNGLGTDRAVMCMWTKDRRGPLSQDCVPAPGYTVTSEGGGHRITLVIPRTTPRDLGSYLAILEVNPAGKTLETACVLQAPQEDSGIKCSVLDNSNGGGATLTVDLSRDLLRSGEKFVLSVGPRAHVTDIPLMCMWASGETRTCSPAPGYHVTSDDDHHRVTLTISNTTSRDLGSYTATLKVNPGEKTATTSCVLQQAPQELGKLEAGHCEVDPVRKGGPATLRMHLGDRLGGVNKFFLKVFKDNTAAAGQGPSAQPILTCDWVEEDGVALSRNCLMGADVDNYNISGNVGGAGDEPVTITVTKLRTMPQDTGNYTLSMHTFPGGRTTRQTCLIQLMEGGGGGGIGTSESASHTADASHVNPEIIIFIIMAAGILIVLIIIGKAKMS